MPPLHTHYDNLKVPRDATPTMIREAYRRLSQKHHPDRNLGDPEAARVMTLINVAYQTLSDPFRRAMHDRWIARHEQAYEPEPTPTDPPPPPPPPPAPARPSKRGINLYDILGSLGSIARSMAFTAFTMLIVMILSSALTALSAWWHAPETRTTSTHALLQTPMPKPVSPGPLHETELPGLSGVYRLVDSDNHGIGPSPSEHSKGKLVIRKLNENTYVVLEAVTIRGSRTFGYGHVYSIVPNTTEPGRVMLVSNHHSWIIGDADQLVKHDQGANYKETLWWKREPAGFSEKYLDRGIEQAELSYRVRVERGLERGG